MPYSTYFQQVQAPPRDQGNASYKDEPEEESIFRSEQTETQRREERKPISTSKPRRQSKGILANTLAKDETRAVRCFSLAVLLVLIMVATLVSVGAYLYMKKDEEDTFEEQYFDLAYRLGKIVQVQVTLS
jgi:cytochrome c-type biogenesis protein CcmH/NrfG